MARGIDVNLANDPPTLDPSGLFGQVGFQVLDLVYEGLTAPGPEGRPQPALAVRWEGLEDGRVWRFHLRDGVRFHTGRPLDATAVKESLEEILRPGRRPGLFAFLLRNVAGAAELTAGTAQGLSGVEVVDADTVEITLTGPDALFAGYPMYIFDVSVARNDPDWHRHRSAGTGPFRLERWTPNVSLHLAAAPGYWGAPPPVDAVRYAVLTGIDAVLNAYDAGMLDVAVVSDDGVGRVLGNPRYRDRALLFRRVQFRYLGLNGSRYPPFADRDVRAAIAAAVDSAGLGRALYAEAAVPLSGFTVPGLAGHAANRERVGEAAAPAPATPPGTISGTPLPPLEIAGISVHRNELSYLADRVGSVLGRPVGVRIMERSAYLAAATAGELPLFLGGWTADYPEMMSVLGPLWHSTSPFNVSRFAHPEVDALIEEARVTLEEDRRHTLYAAIDRILRDHVAAVPLYTPSYVLLTRPDGPPVCLTPAGALCFGRNAGAVKPN
ncbi:ABC transporter substrate-binding protein [Azospirillum halopraeferens]|uniref:ABC transporter substrate-binding protein n=1 Tax=Azospirillum halopraeferens TaxID=34010 RepID=UPI00146FABCF|nr:ABC transporter substrate-binding protein [Azospirillum halopraeferens]